LASVRWMTVRRRRRRGTHSMPSRVGVSCRLRV
jgi:hypothetical protein